MHRPCLFRSLLAGCFAVGLAGGLLTARAQKADLGIELPDDKVSTLSTDELKKYIGSPEYKKALEGLLKGEKPGKEHATALDRAAQWYVFRVTWSLIQEPKDVKKTAVTMQTVHRDFDSLLKNAAKAPQYQAALTTQLVKRLKDVLDRGNRRAKVNAGLMIESLARTGQEDLFDFMVEILQDANQHDAVKLFAIKGLKELFERLPAATGTAPANAARQARVAKAVAELVKYLDPKVDVPKDVADGDKEIYYGVPRYFRREAIRALGQVHLPAVKNQGGQVEGPVAYHLLRVLTDTSMVPPPSLAEQVEAAVGLLNIRPDAGYLPQQALYAVGRFLETRFTEAYKEDWQRTADTGGKKEVRRIWNEPWKIYAARLEAGLEEFGGTATDPKLKDLAKKLKDKAHALFAPMVLLKPKQVDEAPVKNLHDVVETAKPADAGVYKGAAELKVKPTE